MIEDVSLVAGSTASVVGVEILALRIDHGTKVGCLAEIVSGDAFSTHSPIIVVVLAVGVEVLPSLGINL